MITSLKIRNYKSLENVELRLGPLQVLVGPNNSGKSNLFDVFQFLKEHSEIGQQAVYSRGGFSQLVWGGDTKRTISFEIHFENGTGKSKKQQSVYLLEIGGGPQFHRILKESFAVQNQESPLLFATGMNDISVIDATGATIKLSRMDNLFNQFQDEERYGPLAVFIKELQSWAHYDFDTSSMRKPNAVRQDLRLQSAGENFASVLHTIQSEYKDNLSEIESLLKSVLPEVRQLLTPLTQDGKTYVSWQEEAFPMRVPAWAMSDGTLRLLGQLTTLYSPKSPTLATYEEPENYLHPAWLRLVADVLKNAASKNQILLSTHSPYLLNFFSPENLIVVEKKDGRSQFSRVSKKKGLKEALRVLGLGEIWYSGELGGTP